MELKLRIDGKELRVIGQVIGQKIWIHFDGKILVVDKIEKRTESHKNKSSSDESGMITAPMPGKITKVLAEVGHKVKKGQSVIVMEAMKMEYTLKADKDGLLDSLKAKVGDQVTLGQLLGKIK